MTDSILKTVKTYLGIDPLYAGYDQELILSINTAFSTLNQLGVGSTTAFSITSDAETWNDFYGLSKKDQQVEMYICLKTKLFFDPPSTSFVLEALNRSVSELEFRLNVVAERTST